MASFQVNAANTARAFQRLRAATPQIAARALNRSIASARTAMVAVIAPDMGLKAATVRDAIRIQEATPSNLAVRLFASPKRIPLIAFGASGPEPSRGKGRGVTARSGGSRKRYPQAFIATVGSGRHRGVFVRAGGARKSRGGWSANLPIRELFGPSIWHVFVKFREVGLARGHEQLEKNLASEMKFALSKTA